ncbi:GNAT family N-acetyltransferase [Bacillus sp. FJAT-53711]|uniref:GNAT family N-acetyltransferase n=1 Tax=Bacillus yunxiaonensis TaxID=3127665 RepID=A0ABU8FS58_9BACI
MKHVMNVELAKRLEQSEIDTMYSRLKILQEQENNPMGIDIQTFGSAMAFSAKGIPGPSFNTVKGVTFTDKKEIDEVIDYYKKQEIPCRFEITPAHSTPELFEYLSQKGFYQTDFHTTLYGDVTKNTISNEIIVRDLEEYEFHHFGDIYVKSFGMPTFTIDGVSQNNKVLHGKEGWNFYLALLENTPAAIGVLYANKGIASLAASATLPHLQGKGCQTALLKQRMNVAKQLGCELVVGQARFGSISQNNMERTGMKIAYTKAIWMKRG